MLRARSLKRSPGRVGFVCVLAMLAAASCASAHPVPPFGHVGRWIVDAHGRVVVLHGFNVVAKSPPYYPRSFGFDDDDADFLHSQGFNTVRIGGTFEAVEPKPGQIDHQYLDRLAHDADLAARHGLYPLVDLHQDDWSERFSGEGFPAWATYTNGAPDKPDLGFAGNYTGNAALERAFDNFWANIAGPGGVTLQDRYAEAVAAVAERFRGLRGLLGYDLINEPWAGSEWPTCGQPEGCPVFEGTLLTSFYRRVIARLRQVDPKSLAWYEPNPLTNYGSQPHVGPVGDRRAGLSFHDYCLAGGGGGVGPPLPGSGTPCSVTEQAAFDHVVALAAANGGDALLNSEWGATDDLGILARVAAEEDRNLMSWQNWTYYNQLPGGAPDVPRDQGIIVDPRRPPTPDNVRRDKLAVLVRPYPTAVAGTPLSFAFDPGSRTFDFAYSASRPGGGRYVRAERTEVFVPQLQYPHGYRVHVAGARVVSPASSAFVELVRDHGAQTVTVRITPRSHGQTDVPGQAQTSSRTRGSGRSSPARSGNRR